MSIKKAQHLLQSYKMGPLHLKNRAVMAPMTRSRAGSEGLANELMAEYYGQRASAGLIITEGTFVSQKAKGWLNAPGIFSKKHAEAWKAVVNEVHNKGSLIFAQLWHCGRASHSSFHDGDLPHAPSAVAIKGDGIHTKHGKVDYEVPHAMTVAEIESTVADYANAAMLAKEAGFDGIEIHSANGYLLDEFLQSKTNQRTDAYGGSPENRYRFLAEVLAAVIAVWGPGRVGVRLSPNGVFNDMGSPDSRQTFSYVIKELNKLELAYLHVLDGLAFGFHGHGEPMTLKEIRGYYDGTLMGNCGYELDTAEEALASGDAQLIAFGRPFISNPDLLERFANGWPLNPPADMSVWYSFDAKGYTDFPVYESSRTAAASLS